MDAVHLAALAGVLMSSAAQAAPEQTQAQATPDLAQQQSGAESGEMTGLGDIVVTAQRREERLIDVPMSVTVVGAAALEGAGALTTQDLTLVTPGLVVARSSAFVQPTIRGIGNRNSGPGDEPNIATFIDGVYQPEQSATLLELANIERVEVLKGPQGTLFGRNATGGAINLVTKTPSPDFEASASVSAGRYNYLKGTAYLSGSLNQSDTVLASISAVALRDDGYIRNVFLDKTLGDRKAYAGRAKLLFKPTEEITLQLNGLYSYNSDISPFSSQSLNGNTVGRRAPNPTGIPTDIAFPTKPRQTATQFVPFSSARTKLIDGHVEVDLGFATLSGLASWAKTRVHTISDLDASPFPVLENDQLIKARSTNEELVLSSQGESRLSWLLGASLFQGRSFFDPQFINGAPRVYGQKANAYSVFAEATYEVVDNLFLVAGGRYSKDKREAFLSSPTAAPIHGKSHFSDVSPRAVIRYEIGQSANIYASFAEGYKSGTYNPGTPAGAMQPARPERVKAYEVGGKASLGSGFVVNAAAFHYDYTDLQTTVFLTVNGILSSVLQNAPQAKIDGIEFSAGYRPDRHLDISLGLSLLRPRITEFPNASVNVPVFTNGIPTGNVAVSRDIAGNDLLRAPRQSLNLAVNYTADLPKGELMFSANALFSAKYFVEFGNRVKQPAYEIVNGSITYKLPGDKLSIGVFGQNLTNQLYFQSNTISTVSDTIAYAKPRWFGATLSYTY